ncbi:SDR family oxidoreductase [Nocardiopsis gilva YIM 90087]|uniref:SDR family oxidoreductase n=1 Tax=Nocardiopsis gilva YIM 90087 TaxID=1235441 RepID=A0A223S673_9ACTN|nr:SDR family oxidoreductase [Nocardiopsis gilva]ASU83624.1 SDR family oxidoreductase [Nocardiopsis gilva YIM 90087]
METSARLAVISGGGGGIGRALCRELVQRGYEVVALGRSPRRLRELEAMTVRAADAGASDHPPVRGVVCDVTDETETDRVLSALGPVSVLVNNAGTAESAPLHDTTLRSWHDHLAANATSAFLLTRQVIPGMRERDRGRVVFIASTAARAGTPYTAAYTASKHAMLGLARVVAAEVAGTGVTSNAVCPSFVRTPMTERSVQRIAERTGRTPEAAQQALTDSGPLGRLVEPEEVAAAVGYFVSDAAACVNGQSLVLDGGGIQS